MTSITYIYIYIYVCIYLFIHYNSLGLPTYLTFHLRTPLARIKGKRHQSQLYLYGYSMCSKVHHSTDDEGPEGEEV